MGSSCSARHPQPSFPVGAFLTIHRPSRYLGLAHRAGPLPPLQRHHVSASLVAQSGSRGHDTSTEQRRTSRASSLSDEQPRVGRRDHLNGGSLLSGLLTIGVATSAFHSPSDKVASAAVPAVPVPTSLPPEAGGAGADKGLAKELISGLAGGGASRLGKDAILHPLDTLRARLQLRNQTNDGLFDDLYRGIVPPLVVGTPASALFFGVKDTSMAYLAQAGLSGNLQVRTSAAVLAASVPYWLVRTPSEVVKTRCQAGLANNTLDGIRKTVEQDGIGGLYTGYNANIAYAYPTDVIKFLVYDSLKAALGGELTLLEKTAAGSLASCTAQLFTNPLDVIRTRLMTQDKRETSVAAASPASSYGGGVAAQSDSSASSSAAYSGIVDCGMRIATEEGPARLWSGVSPRLVRAVLSGAIQFGSYELVKGLAK